MEILRLRLGMCLRSGGVTKGKDKSIKEKGKSIRVKIYDETYIKKTEDCKGYHACRDDDRIHSFWDSHYYYGLKF